MAGFEAVAHLLRIGWLLHGKTEPVELLVVGVVALPIGAEMILDQVGERGERPMAVEGPLFVGDHQEQCAAGAQLAMGRGDRTDRIAGVLDDVTGDEKVLTSVGHAV